MVARSFSSVLVPLALVVSAAACPHASDLLGSVVAMAPQCFKNCEHLCGPLDQMVKTYMRDQDQKAIRRQVCEDSAAFSCFWKDSANIAACKPVMDTANSFGMAMPKDLQDMHRQCAARFGGDHKDMQSNETEDDGNSSATQALTSGAVAAAAAPVVLLASVAACVLQA